MRVREGKEDGEMGMGRTRCHDPVCMHMPYLVCGQPLVKSGELYTQLASYIKEGSLAGCSFSAGENDIEADRGAGILGVGALPYPDPTVPIPRP